VSFLPSTDQIESGSNSDSKHRMAVPMSGGGVLFKACTTDRLNVLAEEPWERLAAVKREADLHLLLSEHGLQEVLEHQPGPGVQHLDVSIEVFAAPREVYTTGA
jgi:hypothetical protein